MFKLHRYGGDISWMCCSTIRQHKCVLLVFTAEAVLYFRPRWSLLGQSKLDEGQQPLTLTSLLGHWCQFYRLERQGVQIYPLGGRNRFRYRMATGGAVYICFNFLRNMCAAGGVVKHRVCEPRLYCAGATCGFDCYRDLVIFIIFLFGFHSFEFWLFLATFSAVFSKTVLVLFPAFIYLSWRFLVLVCLFGIGIFAWAWRFRIKDLFWLDCIVRVYLCYLLLLCSLFFYLFLLIIKVKEGLFECLFGSLRAFI